VKRLIIIGNILLASLVLVSFMAGRSSAFSINEDASPNDYERIQISGRTYKQLKAMHRAFCSEMLFDFSPQQKALRKQACE